ncbi:MAG: hypothetical protein IPP83_17345 [Flavobacteriales bacterium]|nr:hypothetical protein [Flavobacteriales bacterium]
MLRRYRTHLFLALVAFACAQGWNRWNIQAMLHDPMTAQQVSAGGSVMAVDDASYLQAVDALLGDRPDLVNTALPARPDLRAPGYRLWYLLPRLFFPPTTSVRLLILFQCMLYALVVALLWETLRMHDIAPLIRWTLCLLFAVMPTFHGFLFHTLTEGVTPALSLAVLCGSLMAHRTESKKWMLFALTLWSLLVLTRPALLWVGAALVPVLHAQGRSFQRMALLIVLALMPTAVWWARNATKSGELVGLHPVYRADEPGINRPVHGAFWDLAKSWGARGDQFHGVIEPAFRAAMVCDTSSVYAAQFIQLAPLGSLTTQQDAELRATFQQWQRFNCTELAPALMGADRTLKHTTLTEQEIQRTLERITSEWRGSHLLHHHAVVPLHVLRDLIAHSNLNLILFQRTLRGKPLMELLRWCSAILHVALMIAVLLAALLRVPAPLRWCAWGACAYIGYLAYVQRGVEERYTLPVLFIAVACAAFVLGRRDAEGSLRPG